MNSDPDIASHFGGASELVFWSFRYFLGRRTAATIDFAENLARVWPELTLRVRSAIRRELDDEFERDDEMRADPVCSSSYYPLGANCDRAAWEKVRSAYSKSAPKPSPNPV